MSEEKKAMAKTETGALETVKPEVPYYQPPVDVVETEDAIILTADMPGVGKEDVEINIEKDVLTLTGRVAAGEDDGRPTYVEYKRGNFVRSFTLTEDVDREKISADMNKGVLTLRIPKSEKTKPRKITIKGE